MKHYDEATGSGSVLLDDGRELAFPAGALEGSGLLRLRLGQRVHLVLEDGVTSLRLTAPPQG